METKKVEWAPNMSVGVDRLDEDHKILVQCLNDVIDAVENSEDVFVIDTVFTKLADYTDFHFRREEEVMAACGYPGLESHRSVHEKLKARLEECRKQFALSPTSDLTAEMRDFLATWLREHIMGTDKDYAAAVEGREEDYADALKG